MKKFLKRLICDYIPNHLVNKIPFYYFRNIYYRYLMGIEIGKNSSLHMNIFIEGTYPFSKRFKIGNFTSIGRNSTLDSRGKLIIGNSVSISPNVKILTAQHKINTKMFDGENKSVVIEDYVWIGTGAIILPGVTLEKGSVIAAGSIVTKDVKAFTVVGGNPAKFIKNREKNLEYKCIYKPWFD